MLKFYWQRFVRHHYRRIGGGILCLILSSLAGLAAPLIIKMFIDRALARHDLKILAFIAYAIVAIYALRAVFAWAYSLLMSRLGNTTIMELRSEMYQRLNKLRFSYFIDRPAGTAISLFVDDLILLQQVMVNAIPDLIVETLSLAAIFSIMIVLNWRLALITIFILPSTILLIQNFNRRIVRLAERIDLSQKSVVSLLQQSIASIREVQSYNREEYEYQRFNREIQRVTGSLTGIQYLKAAFIPLVEFMAAIGLTIVVWWGGREVVFGVMSLGEMFAFLIYIINVPAPVRKLTEAAGKLRLGMVAWQRIDRLFAEPTIGPEAGRCQDKLSGQISFERVRFSYTPDRPVLNDLTLSIGRGEFVIIAGASGAGKSTLANLLLRFYDPDGGRICLDGRPVADWQIHSLRRQIGFIQQDALLFACTILENIRYGRPDASLAEVQAAARVANAHDFIVDFPVGYNTRVSEGGSNLSGGQRQRIAIARAVLLNPPILLLDEPTAMLDSQAERQVMQAVRRAGTGRTTILITHRLSVIQPNDRVVYLDGGRVAEQGIYSQLMAANGPFARAVRFWQQNGEKEKPT